MKYIGIDGDNIGSRIELYLLEDNEQSIQAFSKTVEKTIAYLSNKLKKEGMTIIFSGGDSILCRSDETDVEKLCNTLSIESESGIQFSIGIGGTMQQAYMALKYAKTSGKDRIVILEDNQFRIIHK
jgi:GTP cyclohydrolase III